MLFAWMYIRDLVKELSVADSTFRDDLAMDSMLFQFGKPARELLNEVKSASGNTHRRLP